MVVDMMDRSAGVTTTMMMGASLESNDVCEGSIPGHVRGEMRYDAVIHMSVSK